MDVASNIDALSDLKYKLVSHLTFDQSFSDSSGKRNHAFRDINYDNWSFTTNKAGISTGRLMGKSTPSATLTLFREKLEATQ